MSISSLLSLSLQETGNLIASDKVQGTTVYNAAGDNTGAIHDVMIDKPSGKVAYLLTDAHWSQATIGAVLTVSGLTGITLHPSVGAWIDKTRGKRALLIASTIVLSVCGLAVVWAPTIPVVLAADVTMAVLGGVLVCASFDNPSLPLGVQLLDGVGAGMYDALLPLLLADMMRGTGRYSLARGVLGTIQGIGGSISLGAAGFIVAVFGYNAAFLTLAAIAVIALLVVVVAMPETRPTPGNADEGGSCRDAA